MLNKKSSFSVSVYGNGGMNTDYPTSNFYDQSSSSTGVYLAPGVVQNQLALGVSKEVGAKGNQIHLAFNYAMKNSIVGANPLDPPSQQTVEIEMSQMEIEIGFSF